VCGVDGRHVCDWQNVTRGSTTGTTGERALKSPRRGGVGDDEADDGIFLVDKKRLVSRLRPFLCFEYCTLYTAIDTHLVEAVLVF
jgi:hypothetical protein